MSLNDITITVDDVRALNPDSDPLLYVAPDWSGLLIDVFSVPGLTLSGKLWVVSQFFNERYSRQWVINCMINASIKVGLSTKPFFISILSPLLTAINGGDLVPIRDEILEELRVASIPLADDPSQEDKDYVRLLWALRWASEPTNYREATQRAMRDVVTVYGLEVDEGLEMARVKLVEILDVHP